MSSFVISEVGSPDSRAMLDALQKRHKYIEKTGLFVPNVRCGAEYGVASSTDHSGTQSHGKGSLYTTLVEAVCYGGYVFDLT